MINKFNDLLKEALGVTSDGEILSDFLIKYLMGAEVNKTYIFVKPEHEEDAKRIGSKAETNPLLSTYFNSKQYNPKQIFPEIEVVPELPDLEKPVYKVYVNYVDMALPAEAFFDPSSSKYTKNGYILQFTFLMKSYREKIWKHHIYHEIHHAMQFMEVKKKKFSYNKKNITQNSIRSMGVSNVPINEFLSMYYHSIGTEQAAFVAQFYGKLKYRKGVKSIENLDSLFKKREVYEYRIAYKMAYCDVKRLFTLRGKKPLTGEVFDLITREQTRQFFSLLKHMGRSLSACNSIEEYQEMLKKGELTKEIKLISDEELDATIEKYTKYFRKVGKSLIHKMDKTYSMLRDYHIDRLKNGPIKKKEKSIIDNESEIEKIEPIKKIDDILSAMSSDDWD